MKDQQGSEVQFKVKESTPLRKLMDAELCTRCCPKAPIGEGHGTASQEVRVAKIAKPAVEHSKAVKADVAEQFKAEKTVTERTAENAVVEASQIKHVAVKRSLKLHTPHLRRSLWSQRRRRLSQRRQR